jgi:hypothetical protein
MVQVASECYLDAVIMRMEEWEDGTMDHVTAMSSPHSPLPFRPEVRVRQLRAFPLDEEMSRDARSSRMHGCQQR